MFSGKFITFLLIGTAAMLIPLLMCGRRHEIKSIKSILVAICLTVVGTTGTYLMGLVENHLNFGSRSFYGAVFLIPVLFIWVAKLLRISYGNLMDVSAPAVCVMLILMKVLCLLEGCCAGCVLYTKTDGISVTFPSQIVELCNAFLLTVILMVMDKHGKHKNVIYPWYLILYGASRFVLNFFRANIVPFVWILPSGHLWSLCSIVAGIVWLKCMKKDKSVQRQNVLC